MISNDVATRCAAEHGEHGSGGSPEHDGIIRGMGRSQKSGIVPRGRLARRIRRGWRRTRRLVVNQVLHANDPPHRLALGVAIGVFVTFTPTIGFQMMLVLFLAWLFRANKAVGLPVVWLSNPATLVPIYWPCYQLGRWLLQAPPIRAAWWNSITHPPAGWAERVEFYWTRFTEVFWPLWVGGIVIGLSAAYLTYYVVYFVLCSYRMQRWGQLTPPLLTSPDAVNRLMGTLRETPSGVEILRRATSSDGSTDNCRENPNSAA
jgi:uncharacterized protein